MLHETRAFFKRKDVLEVDCPALIAFPNVDAHIDSFSLDKSSKRFLFTSPEYGMKRLLASGAPDIYQLSHVFREEEKSPLHNPEFTMIEWYRLGKNLDFLIDETLELIGLFLGSSLPHRIYEYGEVFQKHAGVDYSKISKEALLKHLETLGIFPDPSFDFDSLLQQTFSLLIEPHLGKGELSVVIDYPESQAALAKTKEKNGIQVAERFEIYYNSIELANGYFELTDSKKQKERFSKENEKRISLGKLALEIDDRFLDSLENLPECSGVAVGFDRLLMLRAGCHTVQEILPFYWDNA